MSEQTPEDTGSENEKESINLPVAGDAAFGQLMDFLASEEDESTTDGSEAKAGAAPAGDGSPTPGGQGGRAPGAPATGEPPATGGKPGAPAEAATDAGVDSGGAGDIPAEWTASSADLGPKLGELSVALEERVAKAYHEEALGEVKTEHAKYFEALNEHPRNLIGREVPKLNGEPGEMETLRDSADAREWQEAIKSVLVEDVRSRSAAAMEENSEFLTTLHGSIEVLQNNPDLMPYTKEFDRELADRFTALAEDFELLVEGKLQGWSIPVQSLINKTRNQLVKERAAGAPAPGTNPGQKRDEPTGRYAKEDGPQGGIQSKAGVGGDDADEYSTLFGTLGMSDFRI